MTTLIVATMETITTILDRIVYMHDIVLMLRLSWAVTIVNSVEPEFGKAQPKLVNFNW